MEEFCEKQRDPNEPASHWIARKQFIVNNWDRYHGNQLASLAMVWSNMEFHGSIYPPELMERVQEMARGITVDDTPMDVDHKPNITVSRSQPFDKPKPKPTPEVISTTNTLDPVKRKREEERDGSDPVEEREGNKFQKTEKRPTPKERARGITVDDKSMDVDNNMGCDTPLGQGGSTEFEHSKCSKRACQPETNSTHDTVISALVEHFKESGSNPKIGPGPALKRIKSASTKLSLERHVEFIEIPGNNREKNGKHTFNNSTWRCNFYLDDVLLASIEAENKHASKKGAAKKAVSILESSDFVVNYEKKVSKLGRNYSKEIVPLDKTSTKNIRKRILDNFTLMEPANPAPAVSILVNSAFKNQVPIEFKTSDIVRTVNGETIYVCRTIINGVTVATGIHMDKREVRNVSANNALALLRDHISHRKKTPDSTQNGVIEPDIKVSASTIKLESEAPDSIIEPNKACDSVIKLENQVSDSIPGNSPKKALDKKLKQTTSPINVQNGILDNFTLMEPANPAPAVSILVNSAFKNQVPIVFEKSDNVRTVNGETGFVCSTIINGVTVATGIHMDKREVRNVSANNALALLRDHSSQRKTNPDSTQNGVSEPTIKVSASTIKLESEASDSVIEPNKVFDSVPVNSPKKVLHAEEKLKQTTSPVNVQNGILDNFTLMEPANPAPAVSILVNSAFKNKVPIEFKTSDNVRTVNGETGFVCSTIINGVTVATGIHINKREVRNVSANNALALLRDHSSHLKNNLDNKQNVVSEPNIKASYSVIEPNKVSDSVIEPNKVSDSVIEPNKASDSVIEPNKASDFVPVNSPKKVLDEKLKQTTSPINVQNGILDNFTLMEPANPAPAVSILVNSAFKNEVPIVFETSDNVRTVNGETIYVCRTIINGVTVATGIHTDIRESKNVSANYALALLRDQSSHQKKNLDNTQNGVIEPDNQASDYVQVQPQKKVKHAPIGESNVGHKLLKLMGWEGGALQKDGIVDPIEASEKFCRGGLGFVDSSPKATQKKMKQMKKRGGKIKVNNRRKGAINLEYKKYIHFDEEKCHVKKTEPFELKSMIPIVESFAQSEQEVLIFSSAFTTYERKSLHTLCNRFKLRSTSYGKRTERRLVVKRRDKTP